MASTPDATHAAPIRPPNSACDELDGRPTYQVTRFHMMAPTSPPKMIAGVIWASSTIPPEMVLATSTERNAPTRLSTADSATAVRGFKAPVAMEVAMALAVSWNPLVKSKMRAVTTTMITTSAGSTLILRLDRTSCPGGYGTANGGSLKTYESNVTPTEVVRPNPVRATVLPERVSRIGRRT